MGRTNRIDVLLDFAAHPKDVLTALPSLSAEQLNQHPEGHPNSIAWLLWHTGREIDVQLSALTGNDELWYSSQCRAALALGDVGDSLGYGHSANDAAQIQLHDAADFDHLRSYVAATLDALAAYCRGLADNDLSDIIAEYEG
ncbi:DinB family protein [Corynebacterium pseudodiphtheriticum]|uniref:DinB family protein n=1 Tax=Corynebacterium pseudodiphtheriticum TaxID=37637 RepID=UPI0020BF50B8|nr:DinB family protein [Corynebacterium pseudodiphtheriticum]UQV53635.1 DinB family protein [Corynebacterium pseudodiphtheriticum]